MLKSSKNNQIPNCALTKISKLWLFKFLLSLFSSDVNGVFLKRLKFLSNKVFSAKISNSKFVWVGFNRGLTYSSNHSGLLQLLRYQWNNFKKLQFYSKKNCDQILLLKIYSLPFMSNFISINTKTLDILTTKLNTVNGNEIKTILSYDLQKLNHLTA